MSVIYTFYDHPPEFSDRHSDEDTNLHHTEADVFERSEDEPYQTEKTSEEIPSVTTDENSTINQYLKSLLYPTSRHTIAAFLLDLIVFYKSAKLSKNSLEKLLKMFSKYFPSENLVPKSKIAFLKVIDEISPSIKTTLSYSCLDCKYDIVDAGEEIFICSMCESSNIAVSLESDINQTLKHFFEKRNLASLIEKSSTVVTKPNYISDIKDSKSFKVVDKLSKYDLSFVHNVDGFPLGNSTTVQVWPNFLSIVELSPNQRKNYLILTNIWVGTGKPDMNKYLKSWVSKMKTLSEYGIEWLNPIDGKIERSRGNVIVSTVDAHARAPLQNIMFCTGSYGCSFCEIPGKSLAPPKKKNAPKSKILAKKACTSKTGTQVACKIKYSNVRYYPYTMSVGAPLRTKLNMLENARKVVDPVLSKNRDKLNKAEKGVKGFTQMALLPNFDISFGFSPDLLHSALLGVVRRHLNFIFDSKYKNKVFHVKPGYQNLISSRLTKIKPPNFITRLPRGLKYLKSWKGSEFLWWILFYSLPCLEKILPEAHFQHQMLLVRALQTLMNDEIAIEDIDYCKTILNTFCSMYRDLYDEKEETFNLHILLHYADAVKISGPLWASSTFLFEAANNDLKTSIHGSKNIPKELCNTYKIYSAIDTLKNVCTKQRMKKVKSLSILCMRSKIPPEHKQVINEIPGFENDQVITYYKKACVKNLTFTVESYNKAHKTCSFYALTKWPSGDIQYIKLLYFISNKDLNCFVGRKLSITGFPYRNNLAAVVVEHIMMFTETPELLWGDINLLCKPLVLIDDKLCVPPKIWDTRM